MVGLQTRHFQTGKLVVSAVIFDTTLTAFFMVEEERRLCHQNNT